MGEPDGAFANDCREGQVAGWLKRLRPGARRGSGKHESELAFWRGQLSRQGSLEQSGGLYARYFTDLFEIPLDFYAQKRMLDIGCGPRGSLEWAPHALERIGLDPLADEYVELHARPHAMRYIQGVSERIPFPDGHFDVVSSINSIDHVDDLDVTIAEITRVTKVGGTLLLLADVNHEATPTEPHRLEWDFVARLDAFSVVDRRDFERPGDNMYDNIFQAPTRYDHSRGDQRPGVLTARLVRSD